MESTQSTASAAQRSAAVAPQGGAGQRQPRECNAVERSDRSAAGRRRPGYTAPRRSVFWVEPELHRAVSEMARRNGRTIMGQIKVIVEEALRREAEQNRRASDQRAHTGARGAA